MELILLSFSLLVEQILCLPRAEGGGTWPLDSPVKRALKSAGSYPKATILYKRSPLSHGVKSSSR